MKAGRVVVQDANVIVDLIEAEVLEAWLGMGFETWTTDFVVNEIQEPKQKAAILKAIENGHIHVALASEENQRQEFDILLTLHIKWAVSIPDASVLRHAMTTGALLMTGDGRLRKAAEGEKVEFRGVLWALDQLVAEGRLTPCVAADALERMLAAGSYLPRALCQERLKTWKTKVR
ncbi:MAG: DUF3368 domain-containing protein [Verrucomicrobia bacterium]|nr:DUF3368 domain-containing protein [Verrucomicrobiota bacterium]MCH8513395.1 hypothetical protein [Kiritimatiellia bacterium]